MAPKPLGHRILIQPDPQPERSDSNLIILPQQQDDHVPVSGTIVALGPGGSHMRYQARQRAIRDCCEVVESTIRQFGHLACLLMLREEIAGMLGTSDPTRDVQIGDRVAYAPEVGLALSEDGQDYIICNEDDVAVLVAEEEEAVA